MPPKFQPPRQDRPQQPPNSLADADKIAINKSVAKKRRQKQYSDVFIITTTSEPTPGDLAKLYIDIHNHLLDHASAQVDHNVDFGAPEGGYPPGFDPVIGAGVPVTSPSSKRGNYFIIQITGRAGEPTLQFAIRYDNLYCVGFRALYTHNDARTKRWYSFGPITNLQCETFPRVDKSGYPEAYKDLSEVKIHPKVIRNVYTHFVYFELEPHTTPDGLVLKDTFFVIVCEGTRYKFAQQLAYSGMRPGSRVPARVTILMSDLIHDWSNVSEAILLLWLAEEEERLHLGASARDVARLELANYEKYAGLVTFRDADGELQLDLLAGRSLYAMLHRDVLRKIYIRKLNFTRHIPRELEPVVY